MQERSTAREAAHVTSGYSDQLAPLLVCFSHLRWDFVWQRPQHLLSRAAKHYRVLHVEEPKFEKGATPRMDVSKRPGCIAVVVAGETLVLLRPGRHLAHQVGQGTAFRLRLLRLQARRGLTAGDSRQREDQEGIHTSGMYHNRAAAPKLVGQAVVRATTAAPARTRASQAATSIR